MRTTAPGPPLSNAQAVAVVRAYASANSRAQFTLDTRLQNQHEEGATARMDDRYFRALRLLGKHADGSSATPPPWAIKVTVPPTPTTPADFLAVVSLPGHATFGKGLLVVRKDARTTDWRTAYEVDVPNGTPLPTPVPQVAAPSRAALTALAAYWQAGSRRTASAGAFLPGQFTTQLTQSLRATNASTLAQHHALEEESARVDPAPQLAFRTAGGGEVDFGAIDVAFTLRRASGSVADFVQPAGRSSLPPFLAPGRYVGFTEDEVFEVALAIPAAGRPVRVIGLNDQLVGAVGTPAR